MGEALSFGVKARKPIPAGTILLEACSCMSSDVVEGTGPSIIESTQDPPLGNRAIMAPVRLVNSNCCPNCQVRSTLRLTFCARLRKKKLTKVELPKSLRKSFPVVSVWTVASLVDIDPGEEITVKYTSEGYYGPLCLCSSCSRRSPTALVRPNNLVDGQEDQSSPSQDKPTKKRPHRGGSKARKSKLRMLKSRNGK